MNKPLVTINLVVLNGEKYIRHCLNTVKAQTYENIEVNILDNNSNDKTKAIIKSEFPQFNLIEKNENLGLGGGMEELIKHTNGKYKVALCVDVLLNADFIEKAVAVMEEKPKIGALQAKIMRYSIKNDEVVKTKYIDTCGMKIFKSRRLINIGHGEEDKGQYEKAGEIFSFEGAVPVFRMQAIKDATMEDNELYDHDFFWYADDIDLGWRMRLMGWSSYYDPKVLAFHDRQTTKKLRKGLIDFIKIRKSIPIFKRRLDWRNVTFALIKNDRPGKDRLSLLKRQVMLMGYFLFFEPSVILETFNVLKLMPKMIRKRKEIKLKSVVNKDEISKWFENDTYIV